MVYKSKISFIIEGDQQHEFINGEWEINLVALPYDIDKILEDLKASDIYKKCHWWAKSVAKCLQTSINYSLNVLNRANEIANNCVQRRQLYLYHQIFP